MEDLKWISTLDVSSIHISNYREYHTYIHSIYYILVCRFGKVSYFFLFDYFVWIILYAFFYFMSLSRIFFVIAFLLEFSAIFCFRHFFSSFPITQSVLKNLNLLTESCLFLRSRFFLISSLHYFVYNEDKCFLCVCTFWTKIQNEYSNLRKIAKKGWQKKNPSNELMIDNQEITPKN